jgi:hypothetical protein
MVATSRYPFLPGPYPKHRLTQSGRIRSQGGREWRDSSRHKVQRRRGAGPREARYQQATQARREQEDSNRGPEHGHCKHVLMLNCPFLLTTGCRSPRACYLTAATLCQEPEMRRLSGGSSTRHPFPFRHSPTAWAAMLRHTPSTPACDSHHCGVGFRVRDAG